MEKISHKNNRKKINHFCGFLRAVEQTGDNITELKFFFEKNAYHTISIYDTKILNFFDRILKICPKIFLFFFQQQLEFCTQTNIFRKNFFCMQNLIFCVHNVVLDTIILAFFLFIQFFFKNAAENSYFFCMTCLCMH